MSSSLVIPFLGALQASVAVLLTIAAGLAAAQFKLLSLQSSRELSKTCVRIFLPCLLIVNVGSQLHLDTAYRYVPVLFWALTYNIVSMGLGFTVTKIFKLPDWTTPAIAFNNTTSLPLLLVKSLAATKLLDAIDSSPDAAQRAESYFLVNAMIGNSLTFALGPRLLNGQEEDAPEEDERKNLTQEDEDREVESQERDAEQANEETSLLPDAVIRAGTRAQYGAYKRGLHGWHRLPSWTQASLDFAYAFLNPPFIGAVLGGIIGLVPALHRLFFNTQEEGGYLNAWLTSAMQNVGGLFAALQVVIVGVKLSQALVGMKKGESAGRVPWVAFLLISAIRFVLWPVVSIGVIYALASKTGMLTNDPILWFCMMLMPTGPPALKLTALADVNGESNDEKMSIAKLLTVSYAMSPLVCFTIVGSLKASQAALGSG